MVVSGNWCLAHRMSGLVVLGRVLCLQGQLPLKLLGENADPIIFLESLSRNMILFI